MRLQDQLDQRKAHFESSAPAGTLKIMHQATADLQQSSILDSALKQGDTSPAFSLPGADGSLVDTKTLLQQGSLVINFFRGDW